MFCVCLLNKQLNKSEYPPECRGLDDVGDVLLCDELDPFDRACWKRCWSVRGALYVHTIRSPFGSLAPLLPEPADSGRVSSSVFNELATSSSQSATVWTAPPGRHRSWSMVAWSWSSLRLLRT